MIREQLSKWLLQPQCGEVTGSYSPENEDKFLSWSNLRNIAIRVFGHRYDGAVLGVLSRYIGRLSELDEGMAYRYHRAIDYSGFMLRWAYQEKSLQELRDLATGSEFSGVEIEAARDLASELWQEELPEILRKKSEYEIETAPESFSDRLRRGEPGLLANFSPEIFREKAAYWGVAVLAGDPEIPDLSQEDCIALGDHLRSLIGTGMVRSDSVGETTASWVFDAWVPWCARCGHQNWWEIITQLIEKQIDLHNTLLILTQFPVLGVWSKDQAIAEKIERGLVAATEKRQRNPVSKAFLRWALHLEDTEAILRCLETLVTNHDHSDVCKTYPIPWIMTWALDHCAFEAARKKRRKASRNAELRLWFMAERSFVGRLPVEEALAWCKEVAPLAARREDLRWMLIDQLTKIDDSRAIDLLIGKERIAYPLTHETTIKIFQLASRRNELEDLAHKYPKFIEGLSSLERGRYLSEEMSKAYADGGKNFSLTSWRRRIAWID